MFLNSSQTSYHVQECSDSNCIYLSKSGKSRKARPSYLDKIGLALWSGDQRTYNAILDMSTKLSEVPTYSAKNFTQSFKCSPQILASLYLVFTCSLSNNAYLDVSARVSSNGVQVTTSRVLVLLSF